MTVDFAKARCGRVFADSYCRIESNMVILYANRLAGRMRFSLERIT
jgi:hypothetical protein